VVDGPLRRVARFIEKPDRTRAEDLVAGGCLWNSGIFAWCAGDILDEVAAHCPEVAPALAAHGDDAAAFFAAVTSVAIDVGVLERSNRMMVLPGTFGWSDVGTWAALRDVRTRDADGNAPHGHVFFRDARQNVIHADGTTVVAYGVDDLVIVALPGLTLVTTPERAADLKTLIESLPPEVRDR
jgi:mannose-1-phosphate guanylyltransferase